MAPSTSPAGGHSSAPSFATASNRTKAGVSASPLPRWVAEALTDRDPRIRFTALQSIGQSRRPQLIDAVCAVAATETDRITFYAAWRALLDIAPREALRGKLRDSRGGVRRAALLA